MNDQSYEEYIRSIVGYSGNNIYTQSPYENDFSYNNVNIPVNDNVIRQYYPKIYRIVNPMIQKICMNKSTNVTEDIIDQMTDEIYYQIEGDNEINININLNNNVTGENKNNNVKVENKQNRVVESREDRQRRNSNPLLRDLIKILIINELLRRPNHRPNPPFPYPGPRPISGGRPPFRPRYENFYNNDYDLYEY